MGYHFLPSQCPTTWINVVARARGGALGLHLPPPRPAIAVPRPWGWVLTWPFPPCLQPKQTLNPACCRGCSILRPYILNPKPCLPACLQPELQYNVALCFYKTKQFGPSLKHLAEIIERGVREHPELSVGRCVGVCEHPEPSVGRCGGYGSTQSSAGAGAGGTGAPRAQRGRCGEYGSTQSSAWAGAGETEVYL